MLQEPSGAGRGACSRPTAIVAPVDVDHVRPAARPALLVAARPESELRIGPPVADVRVLAVARGEALLDRRPLGERLGRERAVRRDESVLAPVVRAEPRVADGHAFE